jgi:hypothetical protein
MPPIPTLSNLMGIWLEVGRRSASWAAWSVIRNQAGGPSFYVVPSRQPKIAEAFS